MLNNLPRRKTGSLQKSQELFRTVVKESLDRACLFIETKLISSTPSCKNVSVFLYAPTRKMLQMS